MINNRPSRAKTRTLLPFDTLSSIKILNIFYKGQLSRGQFSLQRELVVILTEGVFLLWSPKLSYLLKLWELWLSSREWEKNQLRSKRTLNNMRECSKQSARKHQAIWENIDQQVRKLNKQKHSALTKWKLKQKNNMKFKHEFFAFYSS